MADNPFGRQVRERRRSLDLTQEELAGRVGCAAITIRKIEAGALRPSGQVAERLAVSLGVAPDERAAFVRLGRSVVPDVREQAATPRTPFPAPGEGGQDLSGRSIRGYRLAEQLGTGGFGAVYRAVQPLIEREVAIKVILPQYADQPAFIRRFEAEAQLVARLEHPHIVPLYDYWREPGVAYLVMRLLRGASLHQLLQQGPPPLERTARIIEQLGAALQAAHRAGVVHRDLKPANVLLDEEGNAYLADFGIAKDLFGMAELSFAGAFVGSPAYSSPEQIRAEPVTAQTDIYALGVLLFELLTGQRPFPGPTPASYIQQHLSAAVPPITQVRADLPPALDLTIQRATAKVPSARFGEVGELVAEVRAALAAARPAALVSAARPQPAPPTLVLDLGEADNPFKGLRPFAEADAASFFGREALVQQLLGRLGEGGELARFLAVIGPSGSGKSSVVRAGLVPALRGGGLPGSEQWYVADMLPGARPYAELAAALARLAPAGVDEETLGAVLRADHKGLLRAAGLLLPPDRSTELLLVIDQFEELFTLVEDEGERALLLDSLVTAVLDERSRLRVVVTMRADFLDRPLRYVDLGELMRQRSELVLPLTPDELERAIVGPARWAGLGLEDGLVASLVAEVGDQPGGLPLLQHALGELYERRRGRLLTRAAYREIGGVSGALARSAEAVYGELGTDDQAVARLLFLRLVAPGEGADDARRRARLAELSAEAAAVARRFATARLLTFDREPATREPTVEVAHEALLREWPRLRGWLDAARDDLRAQRRLALEAAEWTRAGHDAGFLAGGARLAQYAALAEGTSVALTSDERAFVETSRAEAARQATQEHERQARELAQARATAEAQRNAAGRLRLLVGALALFLVVAAGLSAFAFQQRGEAARQQAAAEGQARLANVRAWSAAALNSLESDPERSLLLGLRAVTETHQLDGTALPEAEDALRRALQAAKLKRRQEQAGSLFGMDWSHDGQWIGIQSYTRGGEKLFRVWDRSLSTAVISTTAGTFGTFVDFSPDGGLVATHADLVEAQAPSGEEQPAPRELTALIYELPSGRLRYELPILVPTFSPDGSRLIGFPAPFMTSGNERIVTYDVATGQLLHEAELPILIEETRYAVLSPDGERCIEVLLTSDIAVFDTATGDELYRLANPYPSSRAASVALTPDHHWLAVGWLSGIVQIYATEDEGAVRLVHTLPASEVDINTVAFSLDGTQLAAGSRDRTITVWDVATGRRQETIAGHSASVQSLAFSPDGRELLSGDEEGNLRLWDLLPGRELEPIFAPAVELAISPGRTRVVGMGSDERVRIWDLGGTDRVIELVGHEAFPEAAAWSDDEKLVATGGDDSTARVWDAATGEQLALMEGHSDWIFAIDVAPDAGRLATGSADGTARIWDTRTGRELLRLENPEVPNTVRFSHDGKRLFAGLSQLGHVLVWDTSSGELLATWKGHRSSVFDMIVSPDGTRLATAGRDGEVRVWDTASGAELLVLRGHTTDVLGLDYSPDGTLLATASDDATVRIWDAATGEALRVISTGESAESAAFTAGGNHLVVGTKAGSATIFTLDLAELVELGRARLTRGWTPEECRQYLQLEQCPDVP